jgi:predicted Zn-dependent peptidase
MPVDRSRLPDLGPDPDFHFPRVVRHMLPNGLDVRTVEHHTVPVVSWLLLVHGGAGADPPGEAGLAALTADMLDEGTGELSAIDVSDGFARIGAEYDVDIGPDAAHFGVTVLSRFVERAMALFADIILRPSLRSHDFDRVRKLRLDRLKQLKDLAPAVAERAFLRLLYDGHPYGHLPIGTEPSLSACRLERVAELHQAVFHPARATLVLAGPLSHERLAALAAGAFGPWRRGTAAEGWRAGDVDSAYVPPRLAVVSRADAAQSELRIGHLSARRTTPDYPALLVLNAILGGQFVSRINRRLREEKGYTYGARTGFDWRKGLAPFALQASVHTPATAESIRETLAELDAIRHSRPPTDEEMELAKPSLTRGYPRNFETAPQVARSVAQLALYDLPDSYFEEFIPRVSAVQRDDVVRAAERYIDSARAVSLVVGDYAAVASSLDALGLGPPQIITDSSSETG